MNPENSVLYLTNLIEMSYRAGDPRLGYRRQGTHADVRDHFDYSASDRQRPFGQEESNRNVPNRNAKYYAMESDYRGRLSKDRHSSKVHLSFFEV